MTNKKRVTTTQLAERLEDLMAFLKEHMVVHADLERFATKEDLKNFATKDDLKRFATKDDLKNFATKDDLKNFSTKADLKNFATKDDLRYFATKEDFERFPSKEDLRRLEDRIFSLEDQQVQLIQRIDIELLAPTLRIDRLEHRVNLVETKLGLAT